MNTKEKPKKIKNIDCSNAKTKPGFSTHFTMIDLHKPLPDNKRTLKATIQIFHYHIDFSHFLQFSVENQLNIMKVMHFSVIVS